MLHPRSRIPIFPSCFKFKEEISTQKTLFPGTTTLWNTLPLASFPENYYLNLLRSIAIYLPYHYNQLPTRYSSMYAKHFSHNYYFNSNNLIKCLSKPELGEFVSFWSFLIHLLFSVFVLYFSIYDFAARVDPLYQAFFNLLQLFSPESTLLTGLLLYFLLKYNNNP